MSCLAVQISARDLGMNESIQSVNHNFFRFQRDKQKEFSEHMIFYYDPVNDKGFLSGLFSYYCQEIRIIIKPIKNCQSFIEPITKCSWFRLF